MKEVDLEAGIKIYTVCVKVSWSIIISFPYNLSLMYTLISKIFIFNSKVDRELLWNRILDRLENEPYRHKYNEHKREWMEAVSDFYG
jgi:hypothetical protein